MMLDSTVRRRDPKADTKSVPEGWLREYTTPWVYETTAFKTRTG